MNKIASVLTGMSSPRAKLCLPVLMAFVLTTIVLFSGGCSDDAADPPFPTQPVPEPRDWLFSVYGTSANDIYAAGVRGVMFHYDGNAENQWTLVPSGTNSAITRIWGSGDGTIYAVGHNGLVIRSSGGSWSGMTSGTTQNLYGIGRFKGDIHACGAEGTLLKLNGSTWGGTPGLSWILDETGAPTDTLRFSEDLSSLVTVNSFFVGGAYNDPRYIGEYEGMLGTKGGVFEIANKAAFPPADPETGDIRSFLTGFSGP